MTQIFSDLAICKYGVLLFDNDKLIQTNSILAHLLVIPQLRKECSVLGSTPAATIYWENDHKHKMSLHASPEQVGETLKQASTILSTSQDLWKESSSFHTHCVFISAAGFTQTQSVSVAGFGSQVGSFLNLRSPLTAIWQTSMFSSQLLLISSLHQDNFSCPT